MNWEPALARTLDACAAIGAEVEIALFLREEDAPRLARVREMLTDVQVARVLVAADRARSGTGEESTPRTLIGLVREQFALDGVPIAGGTDMHFCELNRTHPPVDAIDGIFWSVNPQVHAFDDLSVLETPEALGEQVRAAHVFAGRKPLFVGPVTLMPRPNVESSSMEDDAEGGSRELGRRAAGLASGCRLDRCEREASGRARRCRCHVFRGGWQARRNSRPRSPATPRVRGQTSHAGHIRSTTSSPMYASCAEARCWRVKQRGRSSLPVSQSAVPGHDAPRCQSHRARGIC